MTITNEMIENGMVSKVVDSVMSYVTEASTLQIKPGQALPRLIETDLGNKQPFVLTRVIDGMAEYVQSMGCATLCIFND